MPRWSARERDLFQSQPVDCVLNSAPSNPKNLGSCSEIQKRNGDFAQARSQRSTGQDRNATLESQQTECIFREQNGETHTNTSTIDRPLEKSMRVA